MPAATLPPEVKHRSFPFEVKATGVSTENGQEFGEIEAYGSVFSVIDEGDDEVKPGAFKRTIQASKQRVQSGKANFLAAMLWQHDPNTPIGGWYDLQEDNHGLRCKGRIVLATTKGRECYELIKAGVLDQFSIGYDIPKGGSSYDPKSGVRELTEVRLWEVSPVTFAMNTDALLIGVKGMQIKSVCGDTSLPIGPRDASWDGSEAHSQIVTWATKDDGFIDPAKMKKVHLQVDGDPEKITSYGYAFCNITNGSPVINVGGVKACANALSGARNADPGEDKAGMQRKVETLYRRINAKYQDDTPLTPPWKDDGKSRNRHMQTKTFAEHYAEEMSEDLLEDLYSVWFAAFCKSVVDAFKIGDMPANDISDALDAFKLQFMKDFVPQAIECNLSEYLASDDMDSPLNTSYGGYGGYGYMSNNLARSTKLRLKAGRAISAANQAVIDEHVKNMKSMAMKAYKAMSNHAQVMHDAIDAMGGNRDEEEDGDEEKSRGRYATKAGRKLSAANAQTMHDHADKAMDIMQEHTKAVTTAANDFANVMQGAESPAYGDGEGVADEDQQEGRGKSRLSSSYRKGTPATQHERPRKQSTALEDVEIPASWFEEIQFRKAI